VFSSSLIAAKSRDLFPKDRFSDLLPPVPDSCVLHFGWAIISAHECQAAAFVI